MGFTESGVYRIDWNKLRDLGFEPAEIDPRNIGIYGNPGGMLPQSNNELRPIDLIENSIEVIGQSDGVFNEEDYILFYVDEIDNVSYEDQTDHFSIRKNIYSDTIYYFLTEKSNKGLRIDSKPNLGLGHPKVDSYRNLIYHEKDLTNLLSSGRNWLGEQLNINNEINFNLEIGNLKAGSVINLSVSALAQAFTNTFLKIHLENNDLGSLEFQSIPNSQYSIKGNRQEEWFQLNASQISDQSIHLKLFFDQNNSSNSILYLDNFLMDTEQELAYNDKQFTARFSATQNAISTFKISSDSKSLRIWDVTNPIEAKEQVFESIDDSHEFGTFSNNYLEYVVFEIDDLNEPESFKRLNNQNLRATTNANFIIITHPIFRNQAERLANFRAQHDGFDVQVFSTTEIYNEFSSGRQDISAIRDFLKFKYDQGSSSLKYALFFGKGSFDYKDRIENNTNFVPTYESRNSIHPLLSFSSDDFFGFLDDHEGMWNENSSGDHLLDIGIGRIPARSLEEAENAVDKIILYQTDPNTFGEWRSEMLFVADDGDRNIHQRDADRLATLVDTTYQQFIIKKLYLDSFEQERQPNGERSEEAEQALINAVKEGKLIINFTGHGAEFGWMQERILTFDLIDKWQNPYKIPFLVTATCEFGRNDDPTIESGAEKLIFKNTGGAIGLLTTTRPVFSSTNYRLNEALYGTILNQEGGEYQRLGDIIKFTKNNSLEGSLNRNFILLGDPSMRLNYPNRNIDITEINGERLSISDTLSALQHVVVNGNIKSFGTIDQSFSGEVKLKLYDKNQDKITLGSENDPFEYTERSSLLFNGSASVNSGEFEIDFLIPKNIDYSFGQGKMHVYALEIGNNSDALGATVDFTLGGTFNNPSRDTKAPSIEIFLNDTTSNFPDLFRQDVNAIIKFADESGINISKNVLGQNPELILNDSLIIDLSQYYQSVKDNFSKGSAQVALKDLPEGLNNIKVNARDVYGNPSTAEVEFYVQVNSSFITEIKTYPNPFIDETLFDISHSLEGENLEMTVDILNRNGQLVSQFVGETLRASQQLTILWDGQNELGQKLNPGVYFYTFNIISKTSGKTDFKRGKLIISH